MMVAGTAIACVLFFALLALYVRDFLCVLLMAFAQLTVLPRLIELCLAYCNLYAEGAYRHFQPSC